MSRLMIAGMIAGAVALAMSLPTTAAIAQSRGYSSLEDSITVTAPRMRTTGRGSSGAPIRTIETDSVVYTGDLDLRTRADRRELDLRVAAAAREACAFLDQHYPIAEPLNTARECREDAVNMAQMQVRDAVERSAMVEYGGGY